MTKPLVQIPVVPARERTYTSSNLHTNHSSISNFKIQIQTDSKNTKLKIRNDPEKGDQKRNI